MAESAALNEEFLPAIDSLFGRMIRRTTESGSAQGNFKITAKRHEIILPEDGLALLLKPLSSPADQCNPIFQMADATGALPAFLTPSSS